MAIEVVTELRIGRPVDQVFAHLADLDRWPEWLIATGIQRIGRQASGPATQGEPLDIDQHAAGRIGHFTGTVTRAEAPAVLAIDGKDADGVSIGISAELDPVDPRSTALRFEVRIGLPFRLRIFEGLARPQVQRAVVLDLEAFKRRLESVADD